MTGKLAVRKSDAAMSRNLTRTLERAERYAAERGHGALTLEHLLYSFTEDPDTMRSFKACGVSLDRLREEIAGHLSDLPVAPADGAAPGHSEELARLMADATDATLEANRTEINSFIVLAALVGNEQSDAARLLERHGFTWEKAIQALQSPATAARKPAESGPMRSDMRPVPELVAPLPEEVATTTPWPEADEPEPPIASDPEPRSGNEGEVAEEPEKAPLFNPPAALMPEPSGLGEPRYAAEPRPRASASTRTARMSETPTATPDDIMASVRQKLGTKPPAARKPRPALDLPLAPKWQSINPKSAMPVETEVPVAEAPAATAAPLPPTPVLPPGTGPEPAFQTEQRLSSSAPRPTRPPSNSGLRPTTLEALAAEAARAARGRAEAAQTTWPAPAGQIPPTLDTSALAHSRRLVDLAAERHSPLDDALVEAPPLPVTQPPRPAPRQVEIRLAMPMSAWPRVLVVGRRGEARIELSRADLEALVARASGNSEEDVAGAITLRLKAEGGEVSVEPQSPETQWIESSAGLVDDGLVCWRWVLSPLAKGRATLRLVASIRTLSADGSTKDTGIDEGRLQIRIRGRRWRVLRWLGWVLAAAFGGLEVYRGFTGTDPLLSLISGLGARLFGG